jgi:[CysO sulfur-carrier protein]-S-L-cysteine hydrolase
MNPVSLTRSARALMAARAEADYPEETCGFVFRKGKALEVYPMENVQNREHARDPVAQPRNARTAYCFDPGAMLRLLAEREQAGAVLHAIYHSHPDHDAYFSETDSAAAAPFGEPSYPGAHFVFSVRAGKAVDLKAFDWSAAEGRYVEVPIEERPEPGP